MRVVAALGAGGGHGALPGSRSRPSCWQDLVFHLFPPELAQMGPVRQDMGFAVQPAVRVKRITPIYAVKVQMASLSACCHVFSQAIKHGNN